MTAFTHGTSYRIETLPDDLHDETIPNRDRWAIRDALFWNNCEGWWLAHIADERRLLDCSQSIARFWSPLPPAPMTRQEMLAELNMVVCDGCDLAVDAYRPHFCKGPSEILIEQRRLQEIADSKGATGGVQPEKPWPRK